MSEIIPKGYEIAGSHLRDTKTGDEFVLRDRSFKEIDHSFRGLPSKIISILIDLKGHKNVKILDVGGGQKSKSAKDIARKFDSEVTVVNADVLASSADRQTGVESVHANVFQLPFGSNTFDLVYSRQLLWHFEEGHDFQQAKDNNYQRVRTALHEMVRVLKDGGVLIADDAEFSKLSDDDARLQELSQELKVTLTRKDIGLFLSPLDRIHKIVNPCDYSPDGFLIIQKEPVDTRIKREIDRVPAKLKPW